MPGAHWSQHFESHDDLCTLGLAAAANDEVLSSLFTRGRHRSASPSAFPERSLLQAPFPAPEGRRDSARKDFVQELLPPGPNSSARPLSQGGQLALPRPVSLQSVRGAVSPDEASSSSWQQPSPSAPRRSPHASPPARGSSSATEIPSTLEECAAEIVRLRTLLEAERVAVQQERIRRVACEAELALLHGESKGLGLNAAAAAGDVEKLRSLAKISGVNTADYDKRTPLHVAAAEGSLAAVRCLSEELGAKLSPLDRWGNTPLDEAVQHGREPAAAFLKEKGATHSGAFAARNAAAFRTAAAAGDVAMLRQRAAHTDVNAPNYEGRTPLHIAAAGGYLEAVRLLAALGAKVSPCDNWGNTPLDAALSLGHAEVASHLQSCGALPGSRASQGAALRKAAAAGDVAMLRQLSPHTDVSAPNYEGRTPLHIAAAGGGVEAVDLLIELGSAVSPLDAAGNTPLDDALRQGHAKVAELLEAKGAYSGVSIRKLAQSRSPLRRSAEACVVPLSLGENARNFDAFTQQGVVALGSELEISIEGSKAKPALVSAGCLGPSIVGNYSCHGAEPLPGSSLPVGKTNQDCSCAVSPVGGQDDVALFCVFDGHGRHGHIVSKEALVSMHFELERSAKLSSEPAAALAAAFEAVQAHLLSLATQPAPAVPARLSGACAVVAYLSGDRLTVAGAGDCRAVLASQAEAEEGEEGAVCSTDLSTDHKLDLPEELARLQAAGAYVEPAQGSEADHDYAPARLYESATQKWRGPGLTMSRGLGDTDAAECGFLCTPATSSRTIGPRDLFLILASDGVWEFIDSREAVAIVARARKLGMPASDAAHLLIMRAVIRWAQVEGNYRDDITAMVVYLPETIATLRDRKSSQERSASPAATPPQQTGACAGGDK